MPQPHPQRLNVHVSFRPCSQAPSTQLPVLASALERIWLPTPQARASALCKPEKPAGAHTTPQRR
jgi:hypothetical protein